MSEKKETKTPAKSKSSKYVAVLIRGIKGTRQEVKDTLTMLNLRQKFACTIIESKENTEGMLKKVNSWITYGEIDKETEDLLIKKRGEKDPKDPKKLKKFFRLNPPVGGFERKGTKVAFTHGGALGNRKEKINDLIKRMV